MDHPHSWDRVVDAFSNALEQRDHAAQEQYLRDTLGDDPRLLDEVRAMLQAHEGTPPLDIERRLLTVETETPDLSGSRIGPYRLVRLVATGGMSEVYAAERE